MQIDWLLNNKQESAGISVDTQYVVDIYNKLGLMWDNEDKRVKKAYEEDVWAGYRVYEDDLIRLVVDSYDGKNSDNIRRESIVIEGKVGIRKFDICNSYINTYKRDDKWNSYQISNPIEWLVDEDCVEKVKSHIKKEILDYTAESLKSKFCKKISSI